MKTAIGLSYFDSEPEIKRCLDPLYTHFNYVIAIDGRYEGYDVDHDFSIDNSEDILRKYPNVIMDKYSGWQPLKRQRYLDIAGELGVDYLLVIDTDEYLHPEYTNFTKFFRNLEKYSEKYPDDRLFRVKIWFPPDWRKAHNKVRRNRFTSWTRIHKDPGTMRYAGECHWMWTSKDIKDAELANGRLAFISRHIIDGVRFKSDAALRDADKLDIRDKWAWWNMHEERRRAYYVWCDANRRKHHPITMRWNYDKKGRPIAPR